MQKERNIEGKGGGRKGVHYRDGDEQNCARKKTKRKAKEEME